MMQAFSYRYDLRTAFDDFLTICICAFSQNPLTGKSHDEDIYLATIAKYKKEEVPHEFPRLLAMLIVEMEQRLESGMGNDVLGDFYEMHLYRKGASQYFTPWPICMFMSQSLVGDEKENEEYRRILDPCCGSGRMLLAGGKSFGNQHYFYGIDIDLTCVKMTAINLFLNGQFRSEVMCGDALSPIDFRVSYLISFLPFGIFRIEDKEKSELWHMHHNTFTRKKAEILNLKLPSEEGRQDFKGSQLELF